MLRKRKKERENEKERGSESVCEREREIIKKRKHVKYDLHPGIFLNRGKIEMK